MHRPARLLRTLRHPVVAVAAVGYALAPSSAYPRPLEQVNSALAFLTANAERLDLDAERILLAGDSAGAQIASQVSAISVNPARATRLRGRDVILVDDVLTTGATSRACVRELKRAGAGRVVIGCFARVIRELDSGAEGGLPKQ